MRFLQKRWVRFVGLVPMLFYSFLAAQSVYVVASNTVFRSPNQVFPMTDGVGWLGYLFFLSIVGASGVLAILTAYYMRGVFKILYVAGALAVISSLLFLPLSFAFNASVEFRPQMNDPQSIEGIWLDDNNQLELFSDSTYVLKYDDRTFWSGDSLQYEGTWYLEQNRLHLSHLDSTKVMPWEVRTSDGYWFITHHIPDNPDAWSGDLGLMREEEWLETH